MQDTFIIWKCPWQDATLLLYLFIWSELLCCIFSIFNAFHMVDLYTRIPQQTSTTNPLKAILWNWQLQFASFLTHCDITSLTLFGSFSFWEQQTISERRRRGAGGKATAEDAQIENAAIQRQATTEQALLCCTFKLCLVLCSSSGKGVIPQWYREPGKKLLLKKSLKIALS